VFSGFGADRAIAPEQTIQQASPVARVALLGIDTPGLRPKLHCDQGDEVMDGQPLFHDRAHPEIMFVSPVSGIVESVTYGPRRSLSALVIKVRPETPASEPGSVDATTAAGLRAALLDRGLWPSFLTRPFGRIPAPGAIADAIFVTATGDDHHAPDPHVVLSGRQDAFRSGLKALTLLTDGPVHVCQTPGKDLAAGIGDRIQSSRFSSGPATGLAGHHVHRLFPVGHGRQVWTVGYQDVAAIGELLETGRYDGARVVSLSGQQVRRPRLLRTVGGANLADLIAGETLEEPAGSATAVLSGSVITGRPAAWLGRYHQQVTLIESAPERRTAPERGLKAWFRPRRRMPGPLIPTAALERAFIFDAPPVPLLRALSVGDAETARKLGCLEMVEEDLAPLSMACTSGADYGQMLRHVLDELAEDA
jgi:Na+-transporting NADH:ubiquinone oxidoreductase subunit A